MAKRELAKERCILYAVPNGGIAQTSCYIWNSFLANGLEAPSRRRSEREAAPTTATARSCRRTVLRNPWPSRSPFQQIATRQEISNSGCCERTATRILNIYYVRWRLSNSSIDDRFILSVQNLILINFASNFHAKQSNQESNKSKYINSHGSLHRFRESQGLSDFVHRFLFQFEEISASFPNYCNTDLQLFIKRFK